QVLRALDHVHRSDFVHGDVKPENLLLKLNENRVLYVVLADFGMTSAHDPERARKRDGDHGKNKAPVISAASGSSNDVLRDHAGDGDHADAVPAADSSPVVSEQRAETPRIRRSPASTSSAEDHPQSLVGSGSRSNPVKNAPVGFRGTVNYSSIDVLGIKPATVVDDIFGLFYVLLECIWG
ncbi:unnamed protein product, partial [Amoebophrya sp. A120]